ncbi:docking protein 2 [Lacerta agilis]|uniref:docking protein 2 n=1 Tax=Lacerta agilis TaxID=80427 RepID=UPI001419E07B|nr:docking protein 2 [Lacerta agilis]
MEETVVKKGLLYLLQHQTFGKKWRKFWAVLYRESACAPARLELLESAEKAKKGENSRRLIKLEDCVQVAEAGGETGSPKETAAFFLETTEKCYLVAAERAEAEAWILELCKHAFTRSTEDWKVMLEKELLKGKATSPPALSMAENSLYSTTCKAAERQFPVAVRATEASERCQIWGIFLLCAKADALELRDTQAGEVIYTWPYKFLRRFGHDKVMAVGCLSPNAQSPSLPKSQGRNHAEEAIFSFEAGRRCASGEGSFEFATKQGSEIIQVIEAAINAQRNSTSASSGAALLAGAASPAKPDDGSQGGEATVLVEGQSFRAAGTKSLSFESTWQGRPAKGRLVKPTASCPLSSTNCPYTEGSDAHPRREPQQGSMSEYAEPFDAISKSPGSSGGSCFPLPSTEEPPGAAGLHARTRGLGLSPASLGLHHIYDDPEGLAHLVYDEPQEFTGDAWKVQATPEDPVGHEYPYNPSLDDYSVPKMVAAYAPVQDQNGLGESAYDQVILSLKNKKNAQ